MTSLRDFGPLKTWPTRNQNGRNIPRDYILVYQGKRAQNRTLFAARLIALNRFGALPRRKSMNRLSQWIVFSAAPLVGLLCMTIPAQAQTGAKDGEWRTYGGDLASTRYSPLDQINADNFNKLAVAWRFKTDSLGPRPEFKFEATPLMVHGVLYSTGGSRRAVVALDASTGELLWMHSENEGDRGSNAPRQLSGHGLAYCTDGKEERILYVTPGYRLIPLDANTGVRAPGFGIGGAVDLKKDDDQNIDLVTGEVGLHSTPVVARNVGIVGAAHLTGR